jgi:DNA-binding beta-propeller fold protein YncE
MMRILGLLLASAAATLPAPLPAAEAASTAKPDAYRVLRKATVGGDGGWDYLTVDAAARRLYVSRATRVLVFDADTLEPAGEIPNTPGVHGIALAPALGKGFVSDGRSSAVTVFDLKTLKVMGEIKVTGENPDAILFDDFSGRVFTFNGRTADATAIDAATEKVAGTIALGGKPEFAASDGKGRVFVNIEDKSEVVAFDPKTLHVEARWKLAPCEEPSGMAIDRKNGRLFVGCSNAMMAMLDTASGRVVATVPIGKGVDANAFDPETGLAYASTGEGKLTIAREEAPDRLTAVQDVPTQRGARTMALDARTHHAFLVSAEFGPPPAPTPDQPRPRPAILPGSFVILEVGR